MNPWECGSEFDFREFEPGPAMWPWRNERLYGSGRDAMRALLKMGVSKGWKRLFVPDFFCHEVLHTLSKEISLVPYFDSVQDVIWPELNSNDAILVHNPFGTRRKPERLNSGVWIEDHSHDLISSWAFESEADYALASLRKQLPLPDGGVLWSPKGLPLPAPAPCTAERELAALRKLAGSVLKRAYLLDHDINKNAFRELHATGEGHIASGEVSGISAFSRCLLPAVPLARFTHRRQRNHRRLLDAQVDGAFWLTNECEHPFSAVLVAASFEQREVIRKKLVSNNIYPAVLWSLEEPAVKVSVPALDLSRRILSIHVDHRYGAADMDRLGNLLEPFVADHR